MDNLKYKKENLLEVIRKNRDNHHGIFVDAVKGYHEKMIEILECMKQEVLRGEKVSHRIGIPYPEDHTDDYDTVIRMLELTEDSIVELSQHEFQSYVLDIWDWKQSFRETNRLYTRADIK